MNPWDMIMLPLKVWHAVVSWVSDRVTRTPIDYTDEEYQEILFKEPQREDAEETTEKLDADQPICQRRVGRITSLQTDYGLIDGKYYFDIWRLNNIYAKVGQTVQYYAYRTNANSEWKVTKVTVEEWEEGCSSENPSTVLRECAVIQRVIPVKVEDRRGKILKLSSNLECNLEKTSADFLPIKGDWIELAVLTEISDDKEESLRDNIIEIQSIKARNSRIYCGEITHLRDGLGIINSEVQFREDVCEPGYSSSIGDMVLAKVIESEQGALVSRAILVLPMSNVETGNTLMAHIEQETLFSCRNGISVTEECSKKNLVIGDQTIYNVKVENFSSDTHIITSVTLKNSATSKVMTLRDTVLFPYSLASGQLLELEVVAVASSPGFFSDILILNFEGDWQVACLLDFFVDIDHQIRMPPEADRPPLRQGNVIYERRKNAVSELCATKNGFIIPGRKTIKAPPFLPTRLEHYPIPKLMEEIFMNDTNQKNADLEAELIKTYSFLVEELNPDNYQSKFHMLLHLEDIETLVAIKKYDQERVSFHVSGDFLVMEIANLAESRPSLAVGDKLIATDPAVFKENNARYEGYVHKVGSDRIYLKFNESFQLSYSGKDYSVTFSHNRAPIRRCHQALNEVIKNLRFEWLFPTALGSLKPTQINVIGEFPPSFAERVHQCAVTPKKKPTLPTLKSHKNPALKKDVFWQTEDDEVEDETPEAAGDGPTQPVSSHEYSSISVTANISEIKWQSRTPGPKGAEKNNGNEATPPNLPRPMPKNPTVRKDKVLKWVNQELNHFQREAVRNILKGEARPLPYIIFGPPGTGKTITVVETILQITFLMEDSRILVATPSNSSADLICERLIGWNLSSLVPGNLTRLVGYNYMIDNRMSPLVKSYASVIDLDLSRDEKVRFDSDGVRFASRESIGRSKITIGTCVSLGSLYNLGFPKNHFTHIIIDEAGQSMEPEVLIPLAFMSDQTQAILAGDPRQLGPVVISTIAKLFGLGESLLSRFLIRFPYHRDPESYPDTDGYDPRLVTRLLYNYRSLPEILNFYSTLFYDSKLKAQVCGLCSPEADIVNKLKEPLQENTVNDIIGVIFFGVRGVNQQDEDSPSWYNDHEIYQVTKYVSALYKAGMTVNDVGIITPYQKQVMKIRDQLRYLDLDLPKVGTVEEFQGQERNVIIISTVRSDEGLIEKDRKFALGFVSSQQRLNVAISRARAMLIVIGNPHLLVKDLSWKRFLKMCMEKNCYYGADLPSTLWR